MTSRPEPLASLYRFLLVSALALYLGAVVLQALEHLYFNPRTAAIQRQLENL